MGSGYVASLARPGGNSTGFTLFEYSIAGKWIELLKQISPNLQHAAILRNPTTGGGIGQFGAIQALAPSLGIELVPVDSRQAGTIERDITTFARRPNGGLITLAAAVGLQRKLIIALEAR
jgi:putative ABC transport system substrate-binding protein